VLGPDLYVTTMVHVTPGRVATLTSPLLPRETGERTEVNVIVAGACVAGGWVTVGVGVAGVWVDVRAVAGIAVGAGVKVATAGALVAVGLDEAAATAGAGVGLEVMVDAVTA
jgi:hypothetical protein